MATENRTGTGTGLVLALVLALGLVQLVALAMVGYTEPALHRSGTTTQYSTTYPRG
jgi:hypothetical protein